MDALKYPKIIPELDYSGKKQTNVNKSSFKYWLLSTFFYSRVEKQDKIYLKLRSGKLHYMPLFTMTKALALYNDGDIKGFEKVGKALIESMESQGSMNGWKHENLLQLPGYPKKYSSYSCLNNGRGLGVLVRYYDLHPSKDLLNKIKGVLKTFEVSSSKGGVLKPSGEYLEYSWGDNSPVVWNGFMSALVGLHDSYLHGPDETKDKSKELFLTGIKKLINQKDKLFYEGKIISWIRYDDNKLYFADGPYMNIEQRQLNYLKQSKLLTKKQKQILNQTHKKMKQIHKQNKNKANLYEYFYFIKKRLMR